MKKIVRTLWISMLTGLAFLVACTTHNRLSKAERKQLKSERTSIEEALSQEISFNENEPKKLLEYRSWEMAQRQRLNEINEILGDSASMKQNRDAMSALQQEMDSLAILLNSTPPSLLYGPPQPNDYNTVKEQRRTALMDQLNEIRRTIQRREGACIYGTPEVMERYKQETNNLRKKQAELEKALEELDKE